MADIHTNLHPEGDLSTNVYPNIQPAENVPDSSIESGKLADGVISTAKLADSSVTVAKLADGAVSSAKLADSSVTEAKLADGSVTDSKLASTLSFALQSQMDAYMYDCMHSRFTGEETMSAIAVGTSKKNVLPSLRVLQMGYSGLQDARYAWEGASLRQALNIEDLNTIYFPDVGFEDADLSLCLRQATFPNATSPELHIRSDLNGYQILMQSNLVAVVGESGAKLKSNCINCFRDCGSLTSVKGLDFSDCTQLTRGFSNDTKLAELDVTGISVSFDVSATALAHDALVTVIGNLSTVTTAQTLTMGSGKMALLSQDEILVATGKGWTVA